MDLTCPVEVRGYDLTAFDRGAPRAYVRLFNLESDRIDRFRAIAHWRNPAGREEAVSFVASDLRAGARSEFSLSLSPETLLDAVELEMEFTRVRFESERPDWVAAEGAWVELPPPEPISGREEALLLRVAGQGAANFARLAPGAWICVCGRANLLGAEQCVRCMRGREACLTRFTREAVALNLPALPQSVAEAPPEPELPFTCERRDEARGRMLRERNMRIRRTVVFLLVALILSLFAFGMNEGGEEPASSPPPVETQTRP